MLVQLRTKATTTPFLALLSVSGNEEDHSSLQRICGPSTWTVFTAEDVLTARELLNQYEVSVIFCDRDLTPGMWIHVLEQIQSLPYPPSLIVTSRLADERLWSEALNLGAWDVLAKPLDWSEVIHSVESAWRHWHHQIQLPAMSLGCIPAAG